MEMEPSNGFVPDDKLFPEIEKEIFNFTAFAKGVDWTEPWLICLIIFHIVITTITLSTRNHGNIQGPFFMVLLALVFGSSKLNELAAKNWMYFSRQQYFDSNGMFISIVFSSPILLNCLVIVGTWLWTSGNLMVKVKQAQLRQKLRSENRKRRQRGDSDNSHSKNE